MLVHACVECGKLSANRIAADDLAEHIYEVFERSSGSQPLPPDAGVALLGDRDAKIVKARLFGRE